MMFAKHLTRSFKRWNTLPRANEEVERISSARSCIKNKLYHTRKNFVFCNHKFSIKYGSSKQFHTCAKLRDQLEISHAYRILQNSEAYAKNTESSWAEKDEIEATDIEKIIRKPWNQVQFETQEITQDFETLSLYANRNNESLLDFKYYKLVHVLVKYCKNYFNTNELLHTLRCLELWPSEVYQDKINHEMLRIAQAIDEGFVNMLMDLNVDMIFLINDYFYKMKFLRHSKFARLSLKSLDLQKLSSAQLVQLAFFKTYDRKLNVPLETLEHHLWYHFDSFTLQELGIIGMVFFKNKTKIKNKQFLLKIMNKVEDNIDTIDDTTLTVLLKIIRYNIHLENLEPHLKLQHSLVDKIPHLPLEALTQIAHLIGNTLVHNNEVMSKILDRYEKNIGQARLKDIERLSFILCLFAYDPKTTPFYSAAVKEILDPKRAKEIELFPMSLVYIVMYLHQINYYSEDALNYVMNPDFINKIRNSNHELLREYLILDYCIELDHPEYRGPRLNPTLLEYLKRYGVYYKDESRVSDKLKKLVIDVCRVLKDLLESESAVCTDFLLPHNTKNNIILRYDPLTKRYASPYEQLSQLPVGSIKYAPKDGKKWFAIVVSSHNMLTRDTAEPTGITKMQMRHLERIGYTPILVKYNEWISFKNDRNRKEYLSLLLKDKTDVTEM